MSSDEGELKTTIIAYLKANPRVHSPSGVAAALDAPWNDVSKVLHDLSKTSDVLQSCGLYRYYEFDESNLKNILEVMHVEIQQDEFIDAKKTYEQHRADYRELGMASYLDLLAILERYEPRCCTAITTQIRTEPFKLKTIQESPPIPVNLQEVNGVRMESNKVLKDVVPRIYIDFDTLFGNMVDEGITVDEDDARALLIDAPFIVSSDPNLYRRIEITPDKLIEILRDIRPEIETDEVSCVILFTRYLTRWIELDIRSPAELDQVLSKYYPEIGSSKVGFVFMNKLPIEDKVEEVQEEIREQSLENTILSLMADNKERSRPAITNVLVRAGLSREEANEALESMVSKGTIFKNGLYYRKHEIHDPSFVNEYLKGMDYAVFRPTVIFVKYRDDLRTHDILTPSELAQTLIRLDRVEVIDEKYELLGTDGIDPVSFIKEMIGEDVSDGISELVNYYGIPSRYITKVLKDNDVEPKENDDSEKTPTYDQQILKTIREGLTDTFYSEPAFLEKASELIPGIGQDILEESNLAALGMVRMDGCVISSQYPNVITGFQKSLKTKDIYTIPKELRDNTGVIAAFRREQNVLRWFRYAEYSYISIERIRAIGCDEEKVKCYVDAIEKRYGNETFTLRRIEKDGLDSLSFLGFDKWFYKGILTTYGRMKILDTDGITLFRAGSTAPILGMVIEDIVKREGIMDIYDLMDILKEEYGIDKNTKSILRSVSSTKLHYNEDIEKIYIDNEQLRRYAYD